jgi:hypothetical protein
VCCKGLLAGPRHRSPSLVLTASHGCTWPAHVTLITDFEWHDVYVGQLKGTLLQSCAHILPVDLTHATPPWDIAAAARCLYNNYSFFPWHDPFGQWSTRVLVVNTDFWQLPVRHITLLFQTTVSLRIYW